MAGYPKNFPGNYQVGVVAGGHDGDKPGDQSSNMRIFNPLVHGPDVLKEHLAFSPMSHSPTGFSQQWFHGALDPGTVIFSLNNLGQSQGQIVGQGNEIQGGGGSGSLMGGLVQQLINTEINVNSPPSVQESEVDGAKVRIMREKGQKHKRANLDGLPTHGALGVLSGWKMPDVQQVPTAKEHYSNIQTNNMMGMLPGDLQSMQGMLQGLMGKIGGMTGGAGKGGGGGGGFGGGARNVSTGIGRDLTGLVQAGSDRSNNIQYLSSANGIDPLAMPVSSVKQLDLMNVTTNVETSISYGDYSNLGRATERYANTFNTTGDTPQRYTSRVTNTAMDLVNGNIANTATNFDGTYASYYGSNSGISRMDIIMSNVQDDIRRALNSMTILCQGVHGSDIISYNTGNRVHLETYLDNATDLLCQVTNLDDLVGALHRLQHDETLFGLDKLQDAVINVETAWGNTTANISPNSMVTVNWTKEQKDAMNASYIRMVSANIAPSAYGLSNSNNRTSTVIFVPIPNVTANIANTNGTGANANTYIYPIYPNNVTAPSGTGGGGSGGSSNRGSFGQQQIQQMMQQAQSMFGGKGNLFGDSAQTKKDMYKRMKPEAEKNADRLHKKVTQEQESQDVWKVIQAGLEGQDPTSPGLYKE